MEQQPIVARCIVEIMGAPKEFIAKSLQEHVDKIKQDGLDVQIEKYAEPVPNDKMFTQFVELQISFKDTKQLLDFCFDSMPSSVEIMSPESFTVDMTSFEQFINDLQSKLHHTDMMLKGLQAQKQVIDRNAMNILNNFIKFACSVKPRSVEDLSALLGVQTEELSQFLDGLIKKGVVEKEGEKFIANG